MKKTKISVKFIEISTLLPTLLIAAISLYGWLVRQLRYSSFFEDYVPMAPSTALFMLIISLFLVFRLFSPAQSWRRYLFFPLLWVILVFSILLILAFFVGIDNGYEYKLLGNYEVEITTDEAIGIMSPITALLFVFLSLYFLIPASSFEKHRKRYYTRQTLIFLVFLFSFILLTGYIYNAPLLYGSGIVPVALPTALCFFLLCFPVFYRDGFPFVNPGNTSIGLRLLKSFLPLVIIMIVFQGFLHTNVVLKTQNPTLISALVLFIAIILSVLFIHRISHTFGTALQKAEDELIIKNAEVNDQNRKLIQMNLELEAERQKAEESDRLKSAFLANMSHEIRTPMNGILGFTGLLQERNVSPENQKEFLNLIQKSGDRLMTIINDIIDISKIESGQVSLNYANMDIREHLTYIQSFFQPEADKKKIQFRVESNLSDADAFISGDSEKLYSIFINLVKNAFKFTRKGSIKLVCNHESSVLSFRVQDTGIGIPPDRQKAVFERFIQADILDRDARQGAGLGLAISKAYVEMMGGKIWLESEPGRGSTFFVTIPFLQPTGTKN